MDISRRDFMHIAAVLGLGAATSGMASSKGSKATNRTAIGLRNLLKNENEKIVELAAENLGNWKAGKAAPELWALLKSDSKGMASRQAAATAIAHWGRTGDLDTLEKLSGNGDLATRYAAVAGLAHADLDRAIKTAALLFTEDPGEVDPVPALQVILNNGIQ